MAKFVLHKLVYQTNKYYFLAPQGAYAGIGTESGVTEVNVVDEMKMPPCKVEEILKSPVASRKIITGKLGTKRRYYRILVAADKVDTFDADIVGKSYKPNSSASAVVIDGSAEPRRATYY